MVSTLLLALFCLVHPVTTYESKRKHTERTDSVEPDANAEDVEISGANKQIPYKIAGSKGLYQAACAGIAIDALDCA